MCELRLFAWGDWHLGNHLPPDARAASQSPRWRQAKLGAFHGPTARPRPQEDACPITSFAASLASMQTRNCGATYPGEGENGWPTSSAS